jgi:hypothetical protein
MYVHTYTKTKQGHLLYQDDLIFTLVTTYNPLLKCNIIKTVLVTSQHSPNSIITVETRWPWTRAQHKLCRNRGNLGVSQSVTQSYKGNYVTWMLAMYMPRALTLKHDILLSFLLNSWVLFILRTKSIIYLKNIDLFVCELDTQRFVHR